MRHTSRRSWSPLVLLLLAGITAGGNASHLGSPVLLGFPAGSPAAASPGSLTGDPPPTEVVLDDGVHPVVVDHRERRGSTLALWGRIDPSSLRHGHLVATRRGGRLLATFYPPDGSPALLAWSTASSGSSRALAETWCAAFLGGRGAPPGTPPGMLRLPTPARGEAVVDVLVLFTARARTTAGGHSDIVQLVEHGIDHTNATLANSALAARVRLAGVEEIDYSESDRDLRYADDILHLARSAWVAQRREATRADLVALVRGGTPPNTPNGIAVGMTKQMLGNAIAPFAFSVTTVDAMPITFTHELGHNLGAQHEITDALPPAQSPYPFAYAHLEPGQFRTIMASGTLSLGLCPGCPKIPYFSNPLVTYGGLPTGVDGASDNARAVGSLAPVVATFGTARGILGFAAKQLTVREDRRKVVVEVFRTDGSIGAVSVAFTTAPGTASAGADFAPTSGTLSWGTGEADVLALREHDFHRRRIVLTVRDDRDREPDEHFWLHLSAPGGGASLGRQSLKVVIRANDGG